MEYIETMSTNALSQKNDSYDLKEIQNKENYKHPEQKIKIYQNQIKKSKSQKIQLKKSLNLIQEEIMIEEKEKNKLENKLNSLINELKILEQNHKKKFEKVILPTKKKIEKNEKKIDCFAELERNKTNELNQLLAEFQDIEEMWKESQIRHENLQKIFKEKAEIIRKLKLENENLDENINILEDDIIKISKKCQSFENEHQNLLEDEKILKEENEELKRNYEILKNNYENSKIEILKNQNIFTEKFIRNRKYFTCKILNYFINEKKHNLKRFGFQKINFSNRDIQKNVIKKLITIYIEKKKIYKKNYLKKWKRKTFSEKKYIILQEKLSEKKQKEIYLIKFFSIWREQFTKKQLCKLHRNKLEIFKYLLSEFRKKFLKKKLEKWKNIVKNSKKQSNKLFIILDNIVRKNKILFLRKMKEFNFNLIEINKKNNFAIEFINSRRLYKCMNRLRINKEKNKMKRKFLFSKIFCYWKNILKNKSLKKKKNNIINVYKYEKMFCKLNKIFSFWRYLKIENNLQKEEENIRKLLEKKQKIHKICKENRFIFENNNKIRNVNKFSNIFFERKQNIFQQLVLYNHNKKINYLKFFFVFSKRFINAKEKMKNSFQCIFWYSLFKKNIELKKEFQENLEMINNTENQIEKLKKNDKILRLNEILKKVYKFFKDNKTLGFNQMKFYSKKENLAIINHAIFIINRLLKSMIFNNFLEINKNFKKKNLKLKTLQKILYNHKNKILKRYLKKFKANKNDFWIIIANLKRKLLLSCFVKIKTFSLKNVFNMLTEKIETEESEKREKLKKMNNKIKNYNENNFVISQKLQNFSVKKLSILLENKTKNNFFCYWKNKTKSSKYFLSLFIENFRKNVFIIKKNCFRLIVWNTLFDANKKVSKEIRDLSKILNENKKNHEGNLQKLEEKLTNLEINQEKILNQIDNILISKRIINEKRKLFKNQLKDTFYYLKNRIEKKKIFCNVFSLIIQKYIYKKFFMKLKSENQKITKLQKVYNIIERILKIYNKKNLQNIFKKLIQEFLKTSIQIDSNKNYDLQNKTKILKENIFQRKKFVVYKFKKLKQYEKMLIFFNLWKNGIFFYRMKKNNLQKANNFRNFFLKMKFLNILKTLYCKKLESKFLIDLIQKKIATKKVKIFFNISMKIIKKNKIQSTLEKIINLYKHKTKIYSFGLIKLFSKKKVNKKKINIKLFANKLFLILFRKKKKILFESYCKMENYSFYKKKIIDKFNYISGVIKQKSLRIFFGELKLKTESPVNFIRQKNKELSCELEEILQLAMQEGLSFEKLNNFLSNNFKKQQKIFQKFFFISTNKNLRKLYGYFGLWKSFYKNKIKIKQFLFKFSNKIEKPSLYQFFNKWKRFNREKKEILSNLSKNDLIKQILLLNMFDKEIEAPLKNQLQLQKDLLEKNENLLQNLQNKKNILLKNVLKIRENKINTNFKYFFKKLKEIKYEEIEFLHEKAGNAIENFISQKNDLENRLQILNDENENCKKVCRESKEMLEKLQKMMKEKENLSLNIEDKTDLLKQLIDDNISIKNKFQEAQEHILNNFFFDDE